MPLRAGLLVGDEVPTPFESGWAGAAGAAVAGGCRVFVWLVVAPLSFRRGYSKLPRLTLTYVGIVYYS